MTVCIAALAADSRTIVCVSDKAITYEGYFTWDSDSTKIIRLNERGLAIMTSGGEQGISKVLAALLDKSGIGLDVSETIKICESQYKKAVDELVEAKFLTPRLITRSEYIAAISVPSLNPYFKSIAEKIDEFNMNCDLLLCGFDAKWKPFILELTHPGIVTDMTRTGFHSIGSGWDKANARLLLSEYKRTSSTQRVLYELFDAKANAELDFNVGYEWDAVIVIPPPVSFCDMPKQVKDLVEKVWVQVNRSPFDRYDKEEDISPPPKDWKKKLENLIKSRVLSILSEMERKRDQQEKAEQGQ
jgi:hypothetical protein